MSLAEEYQQRASEIRARLLRPPNAIPDQGIDLKRLPKGMVLVEKKKPEVQEYHPAPTNKMLNIPSILATVAEAFGLGVKDLLGADRKQKVAMARHIAIYFIYIYIPNMTSATIGMRLNRDHSTILHGHKKILRLLADNPPTVELIKSIEAKILAR